MLPRPSNMAGHGPPWMFTSRISSTIEQIEQELSTELSVMAKKKGET
jgi:hypothetical protein